MRSVNKKSKLNIGYKFTFKNDIQMEQLIPNWFNADEKLKLLASDGMLVKRPLLVDDDKVIIGFKKEKYLTIFSE